MACFEGLEREMELCMRADWLAGYSVYVAKGGEVPYVHCAGFADRDAGILISTDTLFRTMSMAKPMTAATAMALAERGKLRLDDPVRKYVPCSLWANGGSVKIPAERDLTILHLCNHTNGLGMSGEHMQKISDATSGTERGLAAWARDAASVPLEFLPGERTGYSSYIGYTLLGCVIEAAADMPFADALNTYLHAPLGMEKPKFHLDACDMPRLSRLYEPTERGLAAVVQSYFPSPYIEDVCVHSGAGGQFLTLDDSIRFAGMLAGGGMWDGVRVLSEQSVKIMSTDSLPANLAFEPGVRWGVGLAVYGDGADSAYSPGSFGAGGYYGNAFWVDPTREMFAVYLFNLIGGHKEDIRRILEREIYAGIAVN